MQTYVIIGAQKCGTTSLSRHLVRHPQIAPAVTKEIHYFDLNFEKGDDWYFSQLPGLAETSRYLATGESSPYYIYHPLVAQRLRRLLPDARLIVMLRDPVARAVSHYHHEVRLKAEHLSLEEAFAQEPARLRGEAGKLISGELDYSFNHQHFAYLSRGVYIDQLRPWMELFPREQFLFLKSEDFYADPPAVYNQVLEFLDLPGHELDDYGKHNSGEYPPVSPAMQRKLAKYFRPHNRKLEAFLGRRFDWDKDSGRNWWDSLKDVFAGAARREPRA